eukprot:PhM_4_TR14712/c0_g2_i2/m.63110
MCRGRRTDRGWRALSIDDCTQHRRSRRRGRRSMRRCRCAQSRTGHGRSTTRSTERATSSWSFPDTPPRTTHRSVPHHIHRCKTASRTRSHSSRRHRPDTDRSSTCHVHYTHPTTLTGTEQYTCMRRSPHGTHRRRGRSRTRAKRRCHRYRKLSMSGRCHVRCTGCCTHQGTQRRTRRRTIHGSTCTRTNQARTCHEHTCMVSWCDTSPWSCSCKTSSRCSGTRRTRRTHRRGHTRSLRTRGTRGCSQSHDIRRRTHMCRCRSLRRSTCRGQSTHHHRDNVRCTSHHSSQLNTDRTQPTTSSSLRWHYLCTDKHRCRTSHRDTCHGQSIQRRSRQSGDTAARMSRHNDQRRSQHSRGRRSALRMCMSRCQRRRRRTRHGRCMASTTHRGTRTGTYRPSTRPHSPHTRCRSSGLGAPTRGSGTTHPTSGTSRCTCRVRRTGCRGTSRTAVCSVVRASRQHTHCMWDQTRSLPKWMCGTHMCRPTCTCRGGSKASARLRGIRRCSYDRCSRTNTHIHCERDGRPSGTCRVRSTRWSPLLRSRRPRRGMGRRTTHRSTAKRKCTWRRAHCMYRGCRMCTAGSSSTDRSQRHTRTCLCRMHHRCTRRVQSRAWTRHRDTLGRTAVRTCRTHTYRTHCRCTGKRHHMHRCCTSIPRPHRCHGLSTQRGPTATWDMRLCTTCRNTEWRRKHTKTTATRSHGRRQRRRCTYL